MNLGVVCGLRQGCVLPVLFLLCTDAQLRQGCVLPILFLLCTDAQLRQGCVLPVLFLLCTDAQRCGRLGVLSMMHATARAGLKELSAQRKRYAEGSSQLLYGDGYGRQLCCDNTH